MNCNIDKNYLTERNYKILVAAAAFGASFLAKEGLRKIYKIYAKKSFPDNPEMQHAKTSKVILSTASVVLISTCAKLLTRKHLTQLWKGKDGKLPSELA